MEWLRRACYSYGGRCWPGRAMLATNPVAQFHLSVGSGMHSGVVAVELFVDERPEEVHRFLAMAAGDLPADRKRQTRPFSLREVHVVGQHDVELRCDVPLPLFEAGQRSPALEAELPEGPPAFGSLAFVDTTAAGGSTRRRNVRKDRDMTFSIVLPRYQPGNDAPVVFGQVLGGWQTLRLASRARGLSRQAVILERVSELALSRKTFESPPQTSAGQRPPERPDFRPNLEEFEAWWKKPFS
eukprot:gene1078-1657_t